MDEKLGYDNYSVLMSVYEKENAEHFNKSIESMILQTHLTNDFVIVKDGPLTPDLELVIDTYQETYPDLFNIIALDENVGLGKALDIGIIICKNELIARMDSDDISLPTRCEKQVEAFNLFPSQALIGTMLDEFYDDPNKIETTRIVPTTHDEIMKFIRRRSPFSHPTVMYKKSAVLDSGGYGGIPVKQDLDLFSRMLHRGYKGMNINESLVLFRANKNNFKRRKSWKYFKGDVIVRHRQLKRKEISFFDFSFMTVMFFGRWVGPTWLLKFVSKKLMRREIKGT